MENRDVFFWGGATHQWAISTGMLDCQRVKMVWFNDNSHDIYVYIYIHIHRGPTLPRDVV